MLGAKGFTDAAEDIAPWLTDWRGRYYGKTPALLAPASTSEVAAIVRLAAAHGVALVPQGGNTSMVGGATPPGDGSAVLVSMRRMNAIRAIDAASNVAIAEAGVVLQTLHETVAAQARRFPLTLGAKGSATIGGLASTNAGGTQVLRFGTMRALVAGIEAVLPDGQVHDGLAVLKKDNRGYDLTQLLVGAEGTLGIITAVALRLVPAVEDRAVAWAGVESPLRLLRYAEQNMEIESFEIVPADTMTLVLDHVPGARAPLAGPHPWFVLVELAGVRGAAARLEAILADAFERELVRDATIAANERQAEAFWHLRDSISEAERAAGPAVQHDISVPVDAMPDFMIDGARAVEAAFPGTHASAFGHLGDGNVHFHVRGSRDAEAGAWREAVGNQASRLVHDLVTAVGGSISAEHGIGQMKRDELLRLAPSPRIAVLRAIKAALDPLGIMNPGKLVP